jgi:hypothetical protein
VTGSPAARLGRLRNLEALDLRHCPLLADLYELQVQQFTLMWARQFTLTDAAAAEAAGRIRRCTRGFRHSRVSSRHT